MTTDSIPRVEIRPCNGVGNFQAKCECGAAGRPRISKARARQDARDHQVHTGHDASQVGRP